MRNYYSKDQRRVHTLVRDLQRQEIVATDCEDVTYDSGPIIIQRYLSVEGRRTFLNLAIELGYSSQQTFTT
jgi:hypothetical protein